MYSFNVILIFGFLTLFCRSSFAQIGAVCHNKIFTFTPRHSLNLTAFSGTWYAQEYASSNIGNTPKPEYKCLQINYTQNTDLHLTLVESYRNLTTNQVFIDSGNIIVNATRSPLNSVWKFYPDNVPWIADMIVLGADLNFAKWSVVYSCSIRPNGYRQETVTALSRLRNIDVELKEFMKALMVGGGFRIGDHWPILQTEC